MVSARLAIQATVAGFFSQGCLQLNKTERRAIDFWWEDPADVGHRGRAARRALAYQHFKQGPNILDQR